jgi:hypothetical protein
MLSYPAAIPLSSRTLSHLADRIRGHRKQLRSRWRRLEPGGQALLALAHLRIGDTYGRLAAGFDIGVTTAWRYVQEVIALLSAIADDLDAAMQRIGALAYAILNGTLIPIDRVADQKPYYSGTHKRHGVNVQVIADALRRLVWASPALPGSAHDLTAARTHDLIDGLTSANVMTFADKGYQGARGQRAHPVQAAPLPAEAVAPGGSGQPGAREDSRLRRTSHCHPQDLEDPGQAALLPTSGHGHRASHFGPAPRRGRPLRGMTWLPVLPIGGPPATRSCRARRGRRR